LRSSEIRLDLPSDLFGFRQDGKHETFYLTFIDMQVFPD